MSNRAISARWLGGSSHYLLLLAAVTARIALLPHCRCCLHHQFAERSYWDARCAHGSTHACEGAVGVAPLPTCPTLRLQVPG